MKIRYKERPKEWRKSVLLMALGLALVSAVLRWRGVIHARTWLVVLVVLAIWATAATVQPRWFRGFYRFSTWAGYWSSQLAGRLALTVIFFVVVTPLGLLFRIMGKDNLRLKRQPGSESYWVESKPTSPVDRQF